MTDTVSFLENTLSLIAKPGTWCKGNFARNSEGESVEISDTNVVQRCVMGSIRTVLQRPGCDVFVTQKAIGQIAKVLGHKNLMSWNDSEFTKHEDIVRVLKEAIANAKKETKE